MAIQWFQQNLIRDAKFITLFCKSLFHIINTDYFGFCELQKSQKLIIGGESGGGWGRNKIGVGWGWRIFQKLIIGEGTIIRYSRVGGERFIKVRVDIIQDPFKHIRWKFLRKLFSTINLQCLMSTKRSHILKQACS